MAKIEDFTKRELEILVLMCDGLSNEEIAKKLDRSIQTISNHAVTIRRMMKAKSRAEVVAKAFHTGLVISR